MTSTLTSRSLLGEERQHMDVNEINCVQYVLSSATLLVSVCQFADGNRDIEAREVSLCLYYLLRELIMRQDVVEKRLRTKLDATGDKFGFGIAMKRLE